MSEAMQFPLQSLCTVRGVRLRILETELRHCRQMHAEAEARRLKAEDDLGQARQQRFEFQTQGWQSLFMDGTPTGVAIHRYSSRLALQDEQIAELLSALCERENESAEALALAEAAAAAWQRARNKRDAVDGMKQTWLRDARNRQEVREELAIEELLSHRASPT